MTARPASVLLRILVVFVTVLLAVVLAERTTGVLQKHYRASVTLQVRGLIPKDQAPSPEEVTTRILSPAVLVPSLRALGKEVSDEALRQWQRTVSVREIRNTELVRIEVTGTNPVEAAEFANVIGEEYQRHRIAEQEAAIATEIAALGGKIAAHRQTVETLRSEGRQLRAAAGIVDFWPDTEDGILPLDEALPKVHAEIAEAKARQEKVAALTDAELLAEFVEGTAFGNTLDPTMADLGRRIREAAGVEERLSPKEGATDDLRKIQDLKARLKKELSDLVPVLRGRLASQAKAAEVKLQLVNQVAPQPPNKEALENYGRTKSRYLEEKNRLEELERQLAEEKINKTMPRNPAVIWERAEPPAHAERGTYFLLALTLLLGLATGTGLAFLSRPNVTVLVLLVLLVAVLASFRYPNRAGTKPAPTPPAAPQVSLLGGEKESEDEQEDEKF
jgi:hypothetical protein